MSRLPPADKLPLALRKNGKLLSLSPRNSNVTDTNEEATVRDRWEEKKGDSEKRISEALGTAWTIDINPLVLYPYAESSYAKENLGELIQGYASSAAFQIAGFAKQYGTDGINDLNAAASEHVLTMDVDDRAEPVRYCGAALKDGKLVILFNAKALGTNDSEAVSPPNVLKAFDEAPAAESAAAPQLSFSAKTGIRKSYDPKIGEIQAKIAEQLGKSAGDITLVPNFESLYAALLAESQKPGTKLYENWEDQLGPFVLSYFDSVRNHLTYNKFATDDMLQEGFNEVVDKGVIEVRLVDKLTYANYCEVVVEDGRLYVQTILEKYGSNIDDAATKIIDQL